MKAVNLIPDEQRRGAGGATGRSGGVAYAIVGVLAGIVGMFAVYTMTNSKITDRQAEISTLKQQVADAEKANDQLAQYATLAQQRATLVSTVHGIATTRFPWAHAMREIARVIPKDTYIDTMDGTVSPTTTASGAGTGTANQPSIHIVGWVSTGHDHTARLMSALRLMDGVDDVTLAISAKGDNTAGAATGSAGPHDQWPKFDITVIYKAPGTSVGTSTTDLKSVSDAPLATSTPSESLGTSSTSAPAPASSSSSSSSSSAPSTGVNAG